jgi:hypothetical protein
MGDNRRLDNTVYEFEWVRTLTMQITVIPSLATLALLFPLNQYLLEKETGFVK